ncbi:MAG: hypothetical protein FD126_2667, partial [Elusimicrobia bacterium]
EENGFLVLAPPQVFQDPKNSMNFIVDEVSVENASPVAIIFPINTKLEAHGLKPLTWGSEVVGGLEEDMTLKARGKTVRWILIEMAKQRSAQIGVNIMDNEVVFFTKSTFKPRKLLNYFDNPFGKPEK